MAASPPRHYLVSAGEALPSGDRFATSRFWRTFPAGMRRRWWLFRVLDLIVYFWPVMRRPKGLLVVRMDGIGDMVLFRRALDRYAEVFGVARDDITVLGCTAWGTIADKVFAGYRVVAIDEHAFARRPFYRFKTGLRVRRLAPAITVNDAYFRRALMADSLTWMSRAPRQVVSLPYISGRTRSEYTYYLSQTDEIVDTGLYPTHEVARHYAFLSAVAGREISPEPPAIDWQPGTPVVAAGAPYVVLNPGSNEPGRRWPLAAYRRIAARLAADGMRVVWVGGPDMAGHVSPRPGGADGTDVIDLAGQTTLAQLFDLIKGAAALVTNDSGPAHVGIALGTPTVVVVGGGHFGCFVPYPEEVRPANARFVFHEMECYHCFWRCHLRESDEDAFPCVAGVTETQVWEALQDLRSHDRTP